MRGIFHRGDNNQAKNRRKETETEKTSDRMRDGDMIHLERPSDRDRAPRAREEERESRERDWRQGDGRGKHGRPWSTGERTHTEQDVKKGKNHDNTFPRVRKEDRDTVMRQMGDERGEIMPRDRPSRQPVGDWEMERPRHQERDRGVTQSRVIEEGRRPPEDIRTQKRERYKVSGVEFQDRTLEVEDSWDRRDRDAGRKREQLRPAVDMRESERYSPQRRPEREMYTESRERAPRRDARGEGDVDERETERREKPRDRDREERRENMKGREREERMPFSRNEKFYQSRRPRRRNRTGYPERCRDEKNQRRENDDCETNRDDRTEVRPTDRERERWGDVRSEGRRDEDLYRNERRDRERIKTKEDEKADRNNRSLSESSSRVPSKGYSRGEFYSEGDKEMRHIRDFKREQRKETNVAKELQTDPGHAGEENIARGRSLDGGETTSYGSDKTRMWLEPRDKTRPRQREGRREDEKEMKSQSEGERDVQGLQGDPNERNINQSRERYIEKREYSEDSEGISVDGDEEEEIWRETFSEEKEPFSSSGGGSEGTRRRDIPGGNVLNYTSGSEEDSGSDSGSREGSDGSWNPDRDRMLSSEYNNMTLPSSGHDGNEREQMFRNSEKSSEPANSKKREEESTAGQEEVINNAEQQRREKQFIFCVVGQTSSQSETSELSLSQDEEKGGAKTDYPNIVDHHHVSDEGARRLLHDPTPTPSRKEEKQFLNSQNTGNGYNIPRGGSFNLGDPSEGECYIAPEDLQDKEVEDIMKKESLPTEMGIIKRDSKTERLLEQWREKNNEKEDHTSHPAYTSCGDVSPRGSLEQVQPLLNEINIQAMSPEEVEAIRIRMSGTWIDPEVKKRNSQAPHLKWAKNVVREILGNSGEQTEDEPNSEAEEKERVKQTENNEDQAETNRNSVNLPILTVEDPHSEPEQEEEEDYEDDLDYRDDNDFRSKSWGEVDLRNVLNSIARHSRKSSFYNRPQLYQQYNEETQNFEILRQSRSDTLSVGEGNNRSPLPSPPPARRPLPPLPSVPHPHSLSLTASGSSAATLSIPERAQSERRASSPSLSVSLKQSSLLWRDLPNVRNNPKLEMLTEDQRRLQEVRFEVVTSEASYCRSLDIVVEHFVKSKELEKLLTTQDKNWLFSRLTEVRAISHRFLSKLEERVESDVLHFTVCDIIARHCQRFRKVYVPYLTNQSYQDATYQRLMNDNPNFKRVVDNLERSSVCQRLPLRSFLVLPFQRITRIKLLVQNILKRTAPGTVEAENTVRALRRLERIIQESNDSIAEMKTIESLVSLSGRVEFVDCKTLPLISQKRRLVREGPITELMDFSLKQTERTIYLHLFNDYLLVSLQKEGGRFTVIDHSPVEELRTEDFRVKILTLQKNSFRLHMSQRSLLLRTETQSDKLRWLSALSRTVPVIDFSAAATSAQMQCIKAYVAQQPDELSVEKADVILVHQDCTDSWVEGTRLSDLHYGWVPKSHLKVISNDKVKKRNLSDAQTLSKAKAAV